MAFESIKNKFPIRFTITDGGLVTPNTLNALSHLSYVILSMVMDSIFMPLNDRGYGIVGARDITTGTRVDKYKDFQVEASLDNNTLSVTVRKGASSYSLARLGKFSDGIYKDLPRYAVLSRDITKTISNVSSTQYYVYITSPVELAFQDGSEFSASSALFPAQYLPANAADSPIVRGLEITEDSIVVSTTLPNSGYLLLAEIAIKNGVAEVKDKREFLIPKIPYYSVDNYSIFKNATEIPEKDNPFIPLHRAIDNVIRYAWALPYLSPSSLFRKGIEKVTRTDVRSNIYFLKPTRVDSSQIALDLTFPDSWEENIINVGGLAYRHNRNSDVPTASSLLNRLDVGTENNGDVYFYLGTDSNRASKLYCKIPIDHLASSNFKLLNGSGVPNGNSYVILGLALLYNPATDLFTPAWVFLPEYNGGVNYSNNIFAVAPQKMYDGNFNLYSREYYPLFGLPEDSLLNYVSSKTNCTICLDKSRFTLNDTYGRGLYNSISSLAFANTKVHGVGSSYVSEGLDRLSALLIAIVGIKLSKSTSLNAEITGIFKNQNNIQYDTSSNNAGVEDQRTFGILFAQDIRIEPRGISNYVSFDLSSDYPMKNIAKLTDYSLRDYIEDLDKSIVFPSGYSGFPTQPPYGKKIPTLYNDPKYGETLPDTFLMKYLTENSEVTTLTIVLDRKNSSSEEIELNELKNKMQLVKSYLESHYYSWKSGPIVINIVASPSTVSLSGKSMYTRSGYVCVDDDAEINIGNLKDNRQIILNFGVGLHFTKNKTLTFRFYKNAPDNPVVNPAVIIHGLLVTKYDGGGTLQFFMHDSADVSSTGSITQEKLGSISLIDCYIATGIQTEILGFNVLLRNVNTQPYQNIFYGGPITIHAANKIHVENANVNSLTTCLRELSSSVPEGIIYLDKVNVAYNIMAFQNAHLVNRFVMRHCTKTKHGPYDYINIGAKNVLLDACTLLTEATIFIKGNDNGILTITNSNLGDLVRISNYSKVYISSTNIFVRIRPISDEYSIGDCKEVYFSNVSFQLNITFESSTLYYYAVIKSTDTLTIISITSSYINATITYSSEAKGLVYLIKPISDVLVQLSSSVIWLPFSNTPNRFTKVIDGFSSNGALAIAGCTIRAGYIVDTNETWSGNELKALGGVLPVSKVANFIVPRR